MQTIWSRIAQTRATCHCPQCIQTAAPGVSRRATASATRQAPQFLTSSTLWYSGIFAAAATFDAGVKKQRREQWNQAIAEVKQELGHGADTTRKVEHEDRREATLESWTKDSDSSNLSEEVDLFGDVAPNHQRSRWPANTGAPLKVYRLAPQSIYAAQVPMERAAKRQWDWKKIETVMLSVDMLQIKIFAALQAEGCDGHQSSIDPRTGISAEYWEQMEKLVAEKEAVIQHKKDSYARLRKFDRDGAAEYKRTEGDIPLCDYYQDEQGGFLRTSQDLNRSLQSLFRHHSDGLVDTTSLLAKIAYNLHISSAPPNVHTYNTLLLGLSRAQQPSLVYSVIRSLRETKVRPNEATISAVLDHFTAMGNKERFIKWTELMRGKHGGLFLARPDIFINEAGKARLVRDEERPGKIIQLPYPTPKVFGSLIRGVLEFGSFDTALDICQNMGNEGWGLCMSGLTPLLKDCADRGDWAAGMAVWRQIQALEAQSVSRRRRGEEAEKIGLGTYAAMIRLCTGCGQKDVYGTVWQQAMEVHPRSRTKLMGYVIGNGARQRAVKPGESEVRGESRSTVLPVGVVDQDHDCAAGEVFSVNSGHILHHIDEGLDEDSFERKRRTIDTTLPLKEDGGTAGIPHPAVETRKRQMQRPSSPVLSQEQLHGLLPPSHELDEYELRERPMTLHG